jgi:hypothetical protein
MILPDTLRPLPGKNVTSPLYGVARSLDRWAVPFDLWDAALRQAGRAGQSAFRAVGGPACVRMLGAAWTVTMQRGRRLLRQATGRNARSWPAAGTRRQMALHAPALLATAGMALTLLPPEAHAWADGGHKVTALVAWTHLTPEERSTVERVLRAHPDFPRHFAEPMLAELGATAPAEEQQRWIFGRAAVWADTVRPSRGTRPQSDDTYHRALWHYADIPVFPTEAMRLAMPHADHEPPSDWQPGSPAFLELKLNAVQALRKAVHETGSRAVPAGQRAVMLCWMFHITGDLHQPCHTAQLFSPHALPSGDRGANSIAIPGLAYRPVHAYWDNLLGAPGTGHTTAATTTAALLADAPLLATLGQRPEELDAMAWLREGHRLAGQAVYPPAVRSAVEDLDRARAALLTQESDRQSYPLDVKIDDAALATYDQTARALGREQAVLAGLRLARLLKGVVAP